MFVEQRFGLQQQIVKIHRAFADQGLLIAAVSGGGQMFFVGGGDRCGLFRFDRRVLPASDDAQQIAGRQCCSRQPQLAQHAARQRFLIAAIINRELGRIPERLGMATQNSHALGVKRTDRRLGGSRLTLFPPLGARVIAQQFGNPLLHLAGRLVGKRDRQNSIGRRTVSNQVGDAKRHDSRLAGTGTGKHQHRTRKRSDGFALRVVQSVKR